MKQIGPSFASELSAAHLIGLPFAWGDDGQFSFDARMLSEQVTAVLAVYAAHDPLTPAPPRPVQLTVEDTLAILVKKGMLTQKDVDDAKAAKG